MPNPQSFDSITDGSSQTAAASESLLGISGPTEQANAGPPP